MNIDRGISDVGMLLGKDYEYAVRFVRAVNKDPRLIYHALSFGIKPEPMIVRRYIDRNYAVDVSFRIMNIDQINEFLDKLGEIENES